jgi:hypothetical protein
MSLLIEELARSRVRELHREAEAQRMVSLVAGQRSGAVGRVRRIAGRALVAVGNRVAGAAAVGAPQRQVRESAR